MMPITAVLGIKAKMPPIVTDIPFPPLNLKNIEELCPKITPSKTMIPKSKFKILDVGPSLRAKETEINDFKKSPKNTITPGHLPKTRVTFVAPEFLLPTSLMLTP
jgi:hypothetical protein